MLDKNHQPIPIEKQRNDIALRLYRLRYSELNDFSQEFVDDVMSIIQTHTRLARIKELERLYDKTPPENGMSDVIADRIEELKSKEGSHERA